MTAIPKLTVDEKEEFQENPFRQPHLKEISTDNKKVSWWLQYSSQQYLCVHVLNLYRELYLMLHPRHGFQNVAVEREVTTKEILLIWL